MAWLKALHIIFLIVWCTGLFYMPALFAHYAGATDAREKHRMRIITRFTFIVIASPAAVLAIITGTILVYATAIQGVWLPAKLAIVAMMGFFHVYCGKRVVQLEQGEHLARRSFHIALVGIPFILVSTVLWLVLAKPVLWGAAGAGT